MKQSRRDFTTLLGLSAAYLASGCPGEVPSSDGTTPAKPAPPTQVVDMHVHLFNANFLPLEGVFKKWVSGSIAEAVAFILLRNVDRCAAGSSPVGLQSAALQFGALAESSEESTIAQLYEQTPEDTFDDARVRRGLVTASPATLIDPAALRTDTPARREAFTDMFEQFAEGRPREMFPERGGFLNWVKLMTWCEEKILAAYQHYYPADLFVAHMMDMENYYKPSKPAYAFPDEQLRRMAALKKIAGSRMLFFTAFDPARDNWREILETSIAQGCAGVKFYPPSGYGPADPDTKKIDPRTRAFFEFCVEKDLPIFTHCTTSGFEARKDNGLRYANPKLWRIVLEDADTRFRRLRICFGHAGGEDGWFGPSAAAAPFSKEVIALCKGFENVYCEVAYFAQVLSGAGRTAFQTVLGKVLEPGGTYDFADKIMYGSDWHMIHKLKDQQSYLKSWQQVFADAKWDGLRERFFSGNARRFLKVGGRV